MSTSAMQIRVPSVDLRRRTPRALASPKSSTFTLPAVVIMMLRGLRSRWTMIALSCACVESGDDLPGDGERVATLSPRAIRSASVSPATSLKNQVGYVPGRVLAAVIWPDVRVVQGRACASLALEAGQSMRSRVKAAGKTLMATSHARRVSRAR